MEMVEYAERRESYFCGWSDDGQTIVIQNPEEFMRQVVPRFFKGSLKFASFKRKLYRWGFRVVSHFWRRVANGAEVIVYQADHFQRGRVDLVPNMRSVTASSRKTPVNHETNQVEPTELSGSRWVKPPTAEVVPGSSKVSTSSQASSSSEESPEKEDTPTRVPSSFNALMSASKPLLNDGVVSFAALKNTLLNDDDASIASLLKMFDLEPNPIELLRSNDAF
jgi:hypothetical protein